MFRCCSLETSHPRLLPQSPQVCSIHLSLFFCFAYRVIYLPVLMEHSPMTAFLPLDFSPVPGILRNSGGVWKGEGCQTCTWQLFGFLCFHPQSPLVLLMHTREVLNPGSWDELMGSTKPLNHMQNVGGI